MTFDEALARAEEARAEVIAVWSALADEPTPAAAEWFAEETFIHYDEHAPDVQRFADGLGAA
jgi:hypothetical protein